MFEREERDPYGFNDKKKGEEIKIYLPSDYYMHFGSNVPKEYSKYLPCVAVLTAHGGDCFYYFKMITEEGIKRASGYAHGFTEKQILEGDMARTRKIIQESKRSLNLLYGGNR